MKENIEYTEDMHAENLLRILGTNSPCAHCPGEEWLIVAELYMRGK